MKKILTFSAVFALLLGSVFAEQVVFAEDDASRSTYANGWSGGQNGGNGFEPWNLYVTQEENAESHAGLFTATIEDNSDIDEVGIKGKAFGFFANGISFEEATAFRRFATFLVPGDSFSFLLRTGSFERKFEMDSPEKGGVGITLRATSIAQKPADYNLDTRLEFGTYEGQENYQIIDGEAEKDTGIKVTDEPISVSITLLTADTYTLEVANLGSKQVTRLENRKLGGSAGAPIESFCAFNRDGEKSDVFFNGFQISKAAQ